MDGQLGKVSGPKTACMLLVQSITCFEEAANHVISQIWLLMPPGMLGEH